MEALQVAYDKAQRQLQDLEMTSLEVCQEIEGAEVQSSGSSIACHLRSLGDQVFECLWGTRVHKTLGLTSTHYLVNFNALHDGYILPEGIEGDDTEVEAIKETDTSVADPATALPELFDGDLFLEAVECEAAAAAAPSPRAL
jgi:hypothetical protein